MQVDLFCMMHPMYLRRMHLGETCCRLAEVVRADWLPPWAAALQVELPEPRVLKQIAYFDGQLKPVSTRSYAPGSWQGYKHVCKTMCLLLQAKELGCFVIAKQEASPVASLPTPSAYA